MERRLVHPRAAWCGATALAALAGCAERAPGPPPDPPAPEAAAYASPALGRALAATAGTVRTRGYREADAGWRGFLVEKGADVEEVALRPERCTVIVATASPALRDLDLRIFDADGAAVAEDDLPGPHAAVRFCPSQSGTYYVVAQARSGSGLFAAQRFEGPTGLALRLDDLFEGPEARVAPAPLAPR